MWLSFDFTITHNLLHKELVGVFEFGKSVDSPVKAFESLLYIDNQIFQAVDINHKEVILGKFTEEKTLHFMFRLWSGLEAGGEKTVQYHQINTAFIAEYKRIVKKYKYLLQNSLETIQILDNNNATKYLIYKAVLSSYDLVNWTNPSSEEFYESISRAYKRLDQLLSLIPRNNDVQVSCVGHTHIDLAWLWRYKHTREKAVRSFSTVNRFMEQYDEYTFMHTSPRLYQSIKEDNPQLYQQIKQRIKEGKWEASGAMWVEADCNIPSGESLIRQIYYGKKFFKEEFNVDNDFLWLPDVFGYSGALPQILVKSNVKTFVTTKISWNDTNRFPHDTFIWKGIDNTPILTHFITTPQKGSHFFTYNGMITPETVQGVWNNYNDKIVNSNLLICYGFGDGGGGPTADMIENIEAIKKIPGLPQITTTTVQPFLEKLHQTAQENKDYLAVWNNELYFEFHRGTYTSQAQTKKNNRLLENLYRETEILCSVASLEKQFTYPLEALEEGWKLILFNQFHDIIPGSSMSEVYEDTAKDHCKAFQIAHTYKQQAIQSLIKEKGENYHVFNTTARKRIGIVSFQNQYQYIEMEPFCCQTLDVQQTATTSHLSFHNSTIDSPFYTITFNEDGQIASLFDKEIQEELLVGPGNVFEIFEDRPRKYDAWEIDESYERKKEIIHLLGSLKLVEKNDCFIKVAGVFHYNKTLITQNIIVYENLKRIDFKTHIDWQERSKLLKVAFPVHVTSLTARYEIQEGSLTRPTHQSTSWDRAKFEVLGHSWADLSDENMGVSLLNNSKYGYDIKDNVMRLSLLKSAEYPDINADRGIQEFTYALYSHQQRWNDSQLIDLAFDLNNPLIAIKGMKQHDLREFIDFSSCDLCLDAIKQCDKRNGYIVRLHEDKARRQMLTMHLGTMFSSWCQANLLEEPIEAMHNNKIISISVKPFEIITFIIQ